MITGVVININIKISDIVEEFSRIVNTSISTAALIKVKDTRLSTCTKPADDFCAFLFEK